MKIGILGSGFGLYGYAPVVAALPRAQLVLAEKSRAILRAREDVGHLEAEAQWVPDFAAMQADCQGLILAVPPQVQDDLVQQIAKNTLVERILLEKPIAATPLKAKAVLKHLENTGIHVGFGYNFRHLRWAQELRSQIENAPDGSDFQMRWLFNAHHFQNDLDNWKRDPNQGGGALRFYGIHAIDLFRWLGFEKVLASTLAGNPPDIAVEWQASFEDSRSRKVHLHIDTRSHETLFEVASASQDWRVELADPYAQERLPERGDRRQTVLAHVVRETFVEPATAVSAYDYATIAGWQATEALARQSEKGKEP